VEFGFDEMAEKTQFMLKKSLDALVHFDAKMARNVCALDDEVDEMNRDTYQKVKEAIRNQPANLDSYIHILGISRHLERIADHTTNIAEDVIYMIEGIITRHRIEDYTIRADKSKD
jgi:phosphate transport system protein